MTRGLVDLRFRVSGTFRDDAPSGLVIGPRDPPDVKRSLSPGVVPETSYEGGHSQPRRYRDVYKSEPRMTAVPRELREPSRVRPVAQRSLGRAGESPLASAAVLRERDSPRMLVRARAAAWARLRTSSLEKRRRRWDLIVFSLT
jgi:hypothetical protein